MPAAAATPAVRPSHCRRVIPLSKPLPSLIARSSPSPSWPESPVVNACRPSMTRRTRSIAPMSRSGSPSIAIRSARLPTLDRSHLVIDATGLGAPARAREQRVPRRDAEAHERGQLERHEAVHAVGPAREAHAGGEVAREALVDDAVAPSASSP